MASEQLLQATPVSILYRQIWQYGREVRGRMLLSGLMLTASQLIKLSVPWFAAQAINAIQASGGGDLSAPGPWVGAIVLAYVLCWALHGPGRIIERSVGIRIRQGVADHLYGKLVQLPLNWHDKHHSGDTSHRVNQATGALYDFAQNQFIYLQNATNILGPLVALWLLSNTTGLVAVAGYLLIGLIIVRFDVALMRLALRENEAERRYMAGLVDFLGNVSTIVSLRLQAASRTLLGRRLAAVFQPVKKAILVTEAKWCAVDILSMLLTWTLVLGYVWQAGGQAGSGAVLVGSVFMVYQYAQQAGGVIGSLATHYQNFVRTKTNFASAQPIFQAEERKPPALPSATGWDSITLSGIGHHYERADGGSAGISGVSFTLRPGERVALVGPSGSGKSTLLRVMAGLYERQHGHYALDGIPQLGLRDLAGFATLIPQEADVFEATLTDNITFGADHDADRLQQAVHISAFDEVLPSLSDGMDTAISERGFNLSGGQRQRLALARGVLAAQTSSIVLMDEPTSALDPLTEEKVHRRFDAAFPNACIVASVHRMSLLHHFDRVVLMADGLFLDTGSVADLIERQPLFRELYLGSAGAQQEAGAAA